MSTSVPLTHDKLKSAVAGSAVAELKLSLLAGIRYASRSISTALSRGRIEAPLVRTKKEAACCISTALSRGRIEAMQPRQTCLGNHKYLHGSQPWPN
jgi:hypothetical protein